MKFLIVDDEYAICELLAERIRALGMEDIRQVDCAYSGEEALNMLGKSEYQVLITDICMSGMDGLELIARIRQTAPALICVIISAFDQFSYAQQGIRLGVHDYWLKPCDKEQMMRSIADIIARYRSEEKQATHLLDAIIGEAIASGDKSMADVFGGQLAWPGGCSRIALCNSVVKLQWDVPDLWMYVSRSRPILFLSYPSEDYLERERILAKLQAASAGPVGVSMPGCSIAEMHSQAVSALALAEALGYRHPLVYRPIDVAPLQAKAQRLVRKTLSVNRTSILEELNTWEKDMDDYAFAYAFNRYYTSLLDELELPEREIRETSSTGSRTGWQQKLEPLLDAMAKENDRQMKNSKRNPVAWAQNYVQTHIGDEIDMAVISNELNMSYQYFSKHFRTQTGMTFSQYVLDARMREACRMLTEGERVATVARKVGYPNPNNFTRAFKKIYSVSPNAFRTGE
ncbi:response regulator [Ruminococcaceae bacterium OttesenSCG-928-L11]|nr:response regulator [Ruminococcaceae bacterium OttesenSCG-928-L11]